MSTSDGGRAPTRSSCGSTSFQDGFIDDVQQGRVRWLAGPLELGLFGKPRRTGRPSRLVRALRCGSFGRLEPFAPDEI